MFALYVGGLMILSRLEDPDFKHGDNTMYLNEARKAWKEGREIY